MKSVETCWEIERNGLDPERNACWESIFCLANGYLSVRAYPEEGVGDFPSLPHQYVAGVFGTHSVTGFTMANLPSWKAFSLMLAGDEFCLSAGEVTGFEQILDLKRAVLKRHLVWTAPSGRQSQLTFESFCSWPRQHVMAQQVEITPLNWEGEVVMIHRLDASCTTLEEQLVTGFSPKANDCGGISAAVTVEHPTYPGVSIEVGLGEEAWLDASGFTVEEDCASREVRWRVDEQRPLRIERLSAICADFDDRDESCGVRAKRELATALSVGWEGLLEEHSDAWAERWEDCDVRIAGDEESQRRIRFYIFHLMQAHRGTDPRLNIGAKLMTGAHYGGHYFWDTEIFDFPFFLYTMPDAARTLAQYRINSLPGAQKKAIAQGHKGAFYPWEADPSGSENCPTWWTDPKIGVPVRIPCGEVQIHINAAVVYALHQYCTVTGDWQRWEGEAAPVVLECARFYANYAQRDNDGSYHIRGIIGPNEYHEYVDDNVYTNYTAHWVLQQALQLLEDVSVGRCSELRELLLITDQELVHWKDVLDGLVVPYNEERQILEVRDGFCDLPAFPFDDYDLTETLQNQLRPEEMTGYQVMKQADVVALFHLFSTAFEYDVMQRCWDYYTPLNVHDSSLSHGSHALVAARLGRSDEAWRHYQAVLDTDLAMGKQHSVDRGVHAANAGGAWFGAVCGFGGVDVAGDYLSCSPRLPNEWNWLSFTVHYQGRRLGFRVSNNHIDVQVSAGKPISLRLDGELVEVGSTACTIAHTRTPKACIFDLDGVLVDSAHCHYRAWKAIADELGVDFDEEKNHQLRGVSRRQSLEILIARQKELSEDDMAHYMEKKNDYFKEMIAEAGASLLLPGVKELLGKLRMMGVRTAVGSASKNAKTILAQTGLLEHYFDVIVDGTDTSRAKPDPEVFLMGAERLGVAPEACIVFEDAPAGVEAARNAGMAVVGIGDAGLTEVDLLRSSIAATTDHDVCMLLAKMKDG